MTSLIVAVTTTTTKGSSFTSSALSMLNIYAYCDCGGKLSKKVCTNTFSDSQIAESLEHHSSMQAVCSTVNCCCAVREQDTERRLVLGTWMLCAVKTFSDCTCALFMLDQKP